MPLLIDYDYMEVNVVPNKIQTSQEESTFKCGVCERLRLSSELKGHRTGGVLGNLDLMCERCWPKNEGALKAEIKIHIDSIKQKLNLLKLFPYSLRIGEKQQETIQECLKLLNTLK